VNINWTITKARGNYRPSLRYTIALTDFERELAMPAVRIVSPIPKPPDAGWTHCWPGQNERGDWTPSEFHLLMTPSHRDGSLEGELRLPWRPLNVYPEVEQGFELLREAFEKVLAESSESGPMREQGGLDTSGSARRAIAPAAAAQRILRAVRS